MPAFLCVLLRLSASPNRERKAQRDGAKQKKQDKKNKTKKLPDLQRFLQCFWANQQLAKQLKASASTRGPWPLSCQHSVETLLRCCCCCFLMPTPHKTWNVCDHERKPSATSSAEPQLQIFFTVSNNVQSEYADKR